MLLAWLGFEVFGAGPGVHGVDWVAHTSGLVALVLSSVLVLYPRELVAGLKVLVELLEAMLGIAA